MCSFWIPFHIRKRIRVTNASSPNVPIVTVMPRVVGVTDSKRALEKKAIKKKKVIPKMLAPRGGDCQKVTIRVNP